MERSRDTHCRGRRTARPFKNIEQLIELCNESGRVIGFVSPVTTSYKDFDIPELTWEEVQEFLRQPQGRLLKDIFADLEKRG